MACTSNNTAKPDVVSRTSSFYGAPQGQAGRTFDSVDYGVQGIVLHCSDMTISQYVQYLACLTQPVIGAKVETNHHYSIGSSGALNQHVDDGNITWTFGNYSAAIYPTPPSPTILINWPTLQALNGSEVSPDVYVINILIAKSYNQGTTCLTASGLPKDQHEKLVQLLAYLSATYNIPLDADHINWHDNIDTQACPSNECNCDDIACLLTDINTFCEEDCNTVTYSEVDCTDISHLLAIPGNCGNSSGCLVSIPFDACCFGDLPQVGNVTQFVGIDESLCLVKNDLQVTAPITGLGTTANPLALDPCQFGSLAPAGTVLSVIGLDDQDCLASALLTDVVTGNETPLTVIDTNTVDLTASGVNGHELTASVKLSTADGNLLTSDATGLFVGFQCDDLSSLFQTGVITNLYGANSVGDCVFQDVDTVVDNAICANPISDGTFAPLHLLGRDENLDCPLFFTPAQIVEAGLTTTDTTTVTLLSTPGVDISAEVKVDPAANNTIEITANGLFVPELIPNALDNCVTVQVVDGQLDVGINISATADNILSCEADGLYVKDLVAVNSDCLDIDYNETTRELTAEILFAGPQDDVMNVAECVAGEGFFVPRGANLLANGPLVGVGTGNDPLDIDFSLLDAQDLCDLGGAIPTVPSLTNVIGTDGSGCLRQYTGEEFIGQFLEIDNGDCITATLTDNSLTIEPVISPPIGAVNNVLSCNPTGLYVPQGAGILPQATNCIALQLVNGVLTATPILDPDAANQLSCNVDGLFVETGAGVIGGTTDCIQVVATQGVVTATPIVSGAILGVANVLTCEPGGLFVPMGAGLTGVSSDCMTVTFDTATGELNVEPIISPLVDNIIQCTANGLYVPNDFIQAVSNTDCIALDVTGNTLTATPIIDPDLENLLECTPNGLMAQLGVLDTSCIDVDITNGIISIEPVIDPAVSNLLTCGVDGMLVELDANVFVDSDCIDFSVTNGLVTAEPILAPDQGPITNILQCIPGQGLYVPVGGGITTLNGSCVSLELVTGVLTAEIIIDNVTPDNALTCGPDGLYVAECCPIVQDTNTVNLTLTTPRTITADVIIDPDATNALVANANGLYVPEDFIQAVATTTCLSPTVINGVLTVDPILDPLADNILTCGVNGLYVPPVTVVDTNCIDADITNNILTINPILSATADNAMQCLADGFYVPECCPIVVDTDSIDLTLTGTRTITADVIIDPDLTNTLALNPNGLFVPTPFVTAITNTQCMALDVTGGVLQATPVIDPAADNQLTCGVTGLYVPPAGGITTAATDCIDVDITGTEITATPIISGPIAGINNALQCTATGLYVPVDFISAIAPTDCIDIQVIDGALIINPVLDPAADNLLSCGVNGLYVPPLNVVSTNCIELEIVGTTLTANPIISATADNALTCLADGFYVPECCPLVLDTDSVNLTLTGTRTISADVIIDPNAVNALSVSATGLFVPTSFITDVVDTQCLDLDVTGGVLSINPIISPLADNKLVCQGDGLYVPELNVIDTDCLDLEVSNNTLTATIILDPAADNQIVCNAGVGLYVPAGAGVTGSDTDCVSVDVINGVVTATPIISGNVDNIITCEADGLYVPQAFIVNTLDTDCIDIDVTSGVLSITPVISPLADNLLTCQGDGLYVPPLAAIDSNCLDIDIVGGTITVNPIISAQAENAIQCLADGFFVQECCPTVTDTDTVDLTLTGLREISADVIIDPDADNALVSNPAGLFVATPLITAINDTQCMDLDVTGGVLTITPIISPLADNSLVCQGDGLYVPPLTAVDTNCIDLDITNNVLTANPIISAQAENAAQCLADGFFVQECCPIVNDTLSVDLTLTGLRTISADVIVDPDVTNSLVINPNGLYVPEAFVTAVNDTPCITLDVTAGVLTATPVIDPDVNNQLECGANGLLVSPITVVDTNCIDLDLTADVLTADIIISAQANNLIQCLGDGLFAEAPIITVSDTDCITLALNGSELTAEPVIDPNIDNQLQCLGTGLFVDAPFITAIVDTNCITLTETAGVLSANPVISPQANNAIQCLGDGLFVDVPVLGVADTDCINLTLDAGGTITADPIIAPAQAGTTNLLSCIPGQGLYVPEGAGITVLDTTSIDLTFAGGVISGIVIIDPAADNLIQDNGQGLYVPPLAAIDNQCIDFTIVNNVITASLVIDPAADNAIDCGANGLFAQQIQVADTNCIDLTFDGVTITADPIIAPAQDAFHINGLQCLADGLYVPYCDTWTLVTPNDCVTGVGADYQVQVATIDPATCEFTIESIPREETVTLVFHPSFVAQIFEGEADGFTQLLETQNINVTNPSNCLPMDVCISAEAWATITAHAPWDGPVAHQVLVEIDGALTSAVAGQNVITAGTGELYQSGNISANDPLCFVLAPGETRVFAVTATYSFNDLGGAGAVSPRASYFGLIINVNGTT